MRLLLATLMMISTASLPAHANPASGNPGTEVPRAPLDAVAEAYVHLTLEIGEHEPGYVDAYYGPAAWAQAAKQSPRSLPALREAAEDLLQQLQEVDEGKLAPLELRRKRLLSAQLVAARTRMAMIAGESLDFDDEAEGLYALRPALQPLAAYDAVLQQLEKLFPGDGPLWQRVDTFASSTAIPPAKLQALMHASIDECRRRTVEHIRLPAQEKFTLELVTGQPWSGYNWYKGDATSLIQINTDLPVLMSRAVDLGCHEGYPGHHVLNMLLEERLSQQRGWIEFTVYPLYSPMSLIAEGSANFGIELALPGSEKQAFEHDVLYPLAGLDPALATRDTQLQQARGKLSSARMTLARDYLDGRIDRAEAVRLAQKYQLLSPERAEQSIAFTDKYRSYVINYGAGLELVRDHVDAAGTTPKARWDAMEKILSEPTLPSDLMTPTDSQ
ncbi:MAG: hypothetical protein ABI858_05290 [Pseudoxanthomonas sp.]